MTFISILILHSGLLNSYQTLRSEWSYKARVKIIVKIKIKMIVRIVRIESEQNGEPHPMIPRKKIKDASKGNGEEQQSKVPLRLYPNLKKKKQIE